MCRKIRRGVILLLTAAASILQWKDIAAQDTDTLSVCVFFRVSEYEIDPSYMGNAGRLSAFLKAAGEIADDPGRTVIRASISAGSSPEGPERINRMLEFQRASALEEAIFATGDMFFPFSKVRCIRDTSAAFEDMRKACAMIVTRPAVEQRFAGHSCVPCRDTVFLMQRDTVPCVPEVAVRKFRKDSLFRTPVAALRSNLLLPLMNIGVEVPLCNRWSLEADWYSPWCLRTWMNSLGDYYRNCFQVQGAYVCGRVWLGRRHANAGGDERYRLRGHSVGVGVGAVHYDVGTDYRGRQGDAIALGADYKYALPLGRGRIHLEFTAGVCVYWERCRDYAVETYTVSESGPDGPEQYVTYSNGRLIGTSRRRALIGIAPFKAAVSIVVPLFRKDRNVEKTEQKEAGR